MIVKNEENNLDRCLNSIAEYVEDIVIVDTGSTDDTKKIAEKYTSKVYDFKWCNDFSKARNFSISKASNDWVLILDADEVIYEFDKEKIEKFININSKVVGRIKRINPFEDGKEIKKYIERVNRVFNKNYFHYEGIIHEQVVSKDGSQYSMKSIDIEADHIGYLNEVINGTNKLERNIDLLMEAIKSNPNDPYLYYQIGKSYYRKKDYNKAYDSFSKSVELCTDFRFEYTEDLIESYGYALLKCEKYTEAMRLDEYKNYYGDSPDYNFIMGLIYMNNGKFQQAVEYFETCIGEKEGKIEGINSYQPNYNIGVIYETLGFKEEAFGFYQRCGEYLFAKKRIEKMIDKKKEGIENSQINLKNINEVKNDIERYIEDANLAEAKMLLKEALEVSNNDLELYSMKSVIEIMENRLQDAEQTLKYSLEIDNRNFDILHNMGYLYEIKGQNQLAVDFYTKALLLSESETMQQELRGHINSIKINAFKTSIIILTYNNLDYNKICIESIRKYTKNNNYEIIVVDNNSKDGTVEWLKEQKDIKVIYNKENLGFPKGCNQGINIATGEEVLLLNNDTIVTPGWLENLRECLYSSEHIGAVGPVTNSCPNYQSIPISYASVEEMIEFAEKHNYSESKKWEERLRLIGYCMLIKKEVIDKVGLLDEIFTPGNFEDDDYSLRMRKAGYKLMLCQNSFIHHFGSASFEKISKEFSELLIKNRKKFFEKWGFDPYHIVDMEKEASEIIISEAQPNANILHIGCAGGATLLKIKSEVPSSNLYGIEECNDILVNVSNFADIKSNLVEVIKGKGKYYFDYILVSNCEYSDFEILKLSECLKEDGTMMIITSEEDKIVADKLKSDMEDIFRRLYIKSKKHKNENIIVASEVIKQEKGGKILPMKNDNISIIITVTEYAQHLDKCIESINRWSTKENGEIIIVNYGSSQQLYKLKQKNNNIIIIEGDICKGYANGINYAISIAKGRDILFIHSDVIITHNSIKKLRNSLYSFEDVGAVGPVTNKSQYNQKVQVDYNSYSDAIEFSKNYNTNDVNKIEKRIKLDNFCILIKKELVTKCENLCETYITDTCAMDDYLFRMRISGYSLLLCKDVFVHHYGDYHLLGNQTDINENLSKDEMAFRNIWGFSIGYSSMIREEIIDLIDQHENKPIKVLEVGCACGATLLQIKNRFKNAELFGIELNENAAKIAKLCANVTAENIENKILSYENNYFDYIIFADVLEHLKKPWLVLSNIRKYLKPDGKILASIPNIMHFSVIRDLLNQRWEYKDWGILDRTHYRFFTLKEVEEMFLNTGYSIAEVNNKFFIQNTEDDSFMEALVDLSEKDLSLQYKTLQYIIKACRND